MILSFDISTTAIGISVIEDKKVLYTDALRLKKIKCLLEKIEQVKSFLDSNEFINKNKRKIKEVRVEQFLQNFRRGFSSADTITKLAGFNTSVQYLLYVKFNKKPVLINAVSARKQLGINLDKDRDTKEQVMEWVEDNIKINLPRKILKGGPRKGEEVMADYANDIADAIVLGLIDSVSINSI